MLSWPVMKLTPILMTLDFFWLPSLLPGEVPRRDCASVRSAVRALRCLEEGLVSKTDAMKPLWMCVCLF